MGLSKSKGNKDYYIRYAMQINLYFHKTAKKLTFPRKQPQLLSKRTLRI